MYFVPDPVSTLTTEEAEEAIQIYPGDKRIVVNTTTDLQGASLLIRDSAGRVLHHQSIGAGNTELPLSAGFYIVQVNIASKTLKTSKILIP